MTIGSDQIDSQLLAKFLKKHLLLELLLAHKEYHMRSALVRLAANPVIGSSGHPDDADHGKEVAAQCLKWLRHE